MANRMAHEDNSFRTKGVVLLVLLVLIAVFVGWLLVIWEVVKFFINWY